MRTKNKIFQRLNKKQVKDLKEELSLLKHNNLEYEKIISCKNNEISELKNQINDAIKEREDAIKELIEFKKAYSALLEDIYKTKKEYTSEFKKIIKQVKKI